MNSHPEKHGIKTNMETKFLLALHVASASFFLSPIAVAQPPGASAHLTPVEWTGPGEIMSILDSANGQLTPPPEGHDWTCKVHVMRPPVAAPEESHPDNQLECSGHTGTNNQEEHRIVLKFGEKSPVSAWGNRSDKDPHFTVYGQIAKRMFFDMVRAESSEGYGQLLEKMEQCAPDGSSCVILYFLNRSRHPAADETAKAMCSAVDERGSMGRYECTFLMFPPAL